MRILIKYLENELLPRRTGNNLKHLSPFPPLLKERGTGGEAD
jgi:hypothetical protein